MNTDTTPMDIGTATTTPLTKDAPAMGARIRTYTPPVSDRPSGAARRRAEHDRLKNGIVRVEEKAGIPRGRQGARRG